MREQSDRRVNWAWRRWSPRWIQARPPALGVKMANGKVSVAEVIAQAPVPSVFLTKSR